MQGILKIFRIIRDSSNWNRLILLLLLPLPGFSALSCNIESPIPALQNGDAIDPYYITGSEETRETIRSLFILLADEDSVGMGQFTVIREIANTYMKQKEYSKLINFLTNRVNLYPDDPYNTYYLFMTAYAYIQKDAYPVAALFFDRIIKNYPDMTILGESIHLACLNQLITLVDNSEQQVWYYEELISRFSDRIDLGATYFMLAQAYEKTGEWSGAIRAYTQYLPFVGTNVPGFSNADNYAKQLVDFNNSAKNWTFDTLGALVNAIKSALDAGSSSRLEQYRAKVNFFTRTWEQEAADDSGMSDFNLSDFMRQSRIRYSPDLDAGSNANEAYLRTYGWSQYISTWYLYFRKIYFPQDPEIHGRWEWAGIYYGEKF
ncbi:MAG: tetratricopeptide repeat protein [Treponema sp.]|jgi:tetratricopeptide (TPR) repeat protein|nr:tetratricopeptide repeat protein [Treponema sp.]